MKVRAESESSTRNRERWLSGKWGLARSRGVMQHTKQEGGLNKGAKVVGLDSVCFNYPEIKRGILDLG